MDREQVSDLIRKYPLDNVIKPDTKPWSSQYDERSAQINYAFVRHFKPTVVVEFGTRGGRCTHDIYKALMDNAKSFTFKPYEKDRGTRASAQGNLEKEFGRSAPKIGGDITEANDIPNKIDYLFVDNSHDWDTTKWVFDVLLKKCEPGALVHFHDIQVHNDYEFVKSPWGEVPYFEELIDKNKFPLEKVYWTYEEGDNGSSTWWTYKR